MSNPPQCTHRDLTTGFDYYDVTQIVWSYGCYAVRTCTAPGTDDIPSPPF